MAHKDRAAHSPHAPSCRPTRRRLSEGAFDAWAASVIRSPLGCRDPGGHHSRAGGQHAKRNATKVATLAGACALCGLVAWRSRGSGKAPAAPVRAMGAGADKSDDAQGHRRAAGRSREEEEAGRRSRRPPPGVRRDAATSEAPRGRVARQGWLGGAPAVGRARPGDWRGPRGDGDFRPRRRGGAAIRDAWKPPSRARIDAVVQDGTEIALTYRTGRATLLHRRRKFAANRVSRRRDGRRHLVVETEAGRIKIKETFRLRCGQLTVRVHASTALRRRGGPHSGLQEAAE